VAQQPLVQSEFAVQAARHSVVPTSVVQYAVWPTLSAQHWESDVQGLPTATVQAAQYVASAHTCTPSVRAAQQPLTQSLLRVHAAWHWSAPFMSVQ
jgi:hypothetical protein